MGPWGHSGFNMQLPTYVAQLLPGKPEGKPVFQVVNNKAENH